MRQVIAVGVGDVVQVPRKRGHYVVISSYTKPTEKPDKYWGYEIVTLRKLNDDLSFNPKGKMIGLELGGYINENFKLILVAKNARYYI